MVNRHGKWKNQLVHQYNSTSGPAGTNSPYDIWPIWVFQQEKSQAALLFLEGHEYSPPLFLGAQQLAINCTNGKLVWSIDAFDVDCDPTTAYGVMMTHNSYDNQIYAFGRDQAKQQLPHLTSASQLLHP